MDRKLFIASIAGVALLLLAGTASAQKVSFKDPTGDDNGPGNYTYPTDGVYKRGSFDMTGFDVEAKGGKVDFDVTLNSPLEDPWRMGGGFSTQMVFIFIDNKDGGSNEGVPGTNISFAPGDEWDYLVILSPQPPGTVKNEVGAKMASRQSSVIVPSRTKGAGRTLSATVGLDELGGGDPTTWGYQVVVQSNEGYPDKTDLLTRKVNEYEGQHRFGGGTDTDCDPHVIDILAADAATQHAMLKYECNPDGSAKQMATLKMVTKQ
ncbi:MAG TPA: glucodextranase DOMON-like domain-containing protein [Thermoanaerobaculia bacterium]|nr:glucodextranase DOMON-like domain-containing protein [Thermoanaerobaculia bacterium]